MIFGHSRPGPGARGQRPAYMLAAGRCLAKRSPPGVVHQIGLTLPRRQQRALSGGSLVTS